MKLGGRAQAAIEVLTDIMSNHTPATQALRDWGKAHRFAGSKDRSAIGNLVHDVLRQKSSLAWKMGCVDVGEAKPRELVLACLVYDWGYEPSELVSHFEADKFAPKPLSHAELHGLNQPEDLSLAPDWVRADVPEWIWPSFEANFGEDAVKEGEALALRPPLDLRINTLKTTADQALSALTEFGGKPCKLSPIGLRIKSQQREQRMPNIQAEMIYVTGGVEIQDEGSQIAALLVDAQPGDNILDFCAGGGGKTLALSAQMGGQGSLYAFDIDKRRLAPLFQRAMRAGADNIELKSPVKGEPYKALEPLKGKMDRVLIDAPCTGVGTWRRKPDAKWRLSERNLEQRTAQQKEVLEQASLYVKSGGYLIYVTCSMLAEENEGAVYDFLENFEDFQIVSAGEVWEDTFAANAGQPYSTDGASVTLTPASTQTDGFYFAVMERTAS